MLNLLRKVVVEVVGVDENAACNDTSAAGVERGWWEKKGGHF
jgi:hypothetical protein